MLDFRDIGKYVKIFEILREIRSKMDGRRGNKEKIWNG
jgi:hypothetical protein